MSHKIQLEVIRQYHVGDGFNYNGRKYRYAMAIVGGHALMRMDGTEISEAFSDAEITSLLSNGCLERLACTLESGGAARAH